MNYERISEYLRAELKRRKIKQIRLSIDTMIPVNTVHRIVWGKTNIKVKDLEDICRALGIVITIGDDSDPIIRRRG